MSQFKLKSKLFVVFCLLVHCSLNSLCGFQKAEKLPLQNFKVDPTRTSSLINSIFEYKIIPLGVEANVLLPKIRLLGVFKDRLFVSSVSYRRNKVYIFDDQGNYINTIDRGGDGPGEYVAIYNVVSMPNNNYGLQDIMGQKLLLVDAMGEYLEERRLNLGVNVLKNIEGGFVGTVRDEDVADKGALVIFNNKLQVVNTFLSRVPIPGPLANVSSLVSLNSGFAYMPYGETGVYKGNNEETWAAYFFDFGKYGPEFNTNGIPDFNTKVSSLNYLETQSHLFLDYSLGFGNHLLTSVNKEDGYVVTNQLKNVIGDDLPGYSRSDSEFFYLFLHILLKNYLKL